MFNSTSLSDCVLSGCMYALGLSCILDDECTLDISMSVFLCMNQLVRKTIGST